MKTQKTIMGNAFKKFMLSLALVLLCAVSMQAQVTIGGNVFGGGRMADVNGKTDILVIGQAAAGGNENKTVIHGIFGGNDIAGGVVGADGSTIVIGADPDQQDPSSYNGNNHAIEIMEVYGAGNGYYTYPSPVTVDLNSHGVTSVSGTTFTGFVKDFENESNIENVTGGKVVPHIRKTDISVLGSAVKIGDLFGGAKNAFVLDNCATAVNIKIDDGIIHSVFGGNNVGGSIPGDIEITVNNTKIVSPVDYTNIGQTFGIYELYGGGNKVVAPGNVTVNVKGGMIDQCFAGGNSATVGTGSCTVDGNPVHNGTTVLVATTGDAIYTAGTDYNGQSGVYNIRTLFGGNNQAPMNILPTLTLTKGGIGTVYGGGNAGNMVANETVDGRQVSTNIQFTAEGDAANMLVDVVYGGCKSADVAQGTNINLNSSKTTVGTIYGACNVSGDVAGDSYVTLAKGNVKKAVFGGANGDYGCNDGTHYTAPVDALVTAGVTTIPTIKNTHVYVEGSAVIGTAEVPANIYGGGNMAPVGKNAEDQYGTTEVKLVSGDVHGSAFGGGNMASVNGVAKIYTPSTSTIYITNVFGGNDKSGSVSGAGYPGGAVALDGTTALTAANAASYVSIEGHPTITNVYGGGNGLYDYTALNATRNCSFSAPTQASTYVDIKTDGTEAIDNTYGGGKAADVSGTATTKLLAGSVTKVFGGNDYAGNVAIAKVELAQADASTMTVADLYGAGNGQYSDYNTSGKTRPTADQAIVNLTTGTVGNVYGGGLAGDVAQTTTTIESGAAVTGLIFGGGCGDVAHYGLCASDYPHVGNVTDKATLNINGLADIADHNYRIFAGGRAGDVKNAEINVADDVAQPISAIYGGCMASDLTGTTSVNIGTDPTLAGPQIDTVYGGNDYSGLTNKTRITINNGTFTHVFGGGNGDYDYVEEIMDRFGIVEVDNLPDCLDTLPYSMDIDVTYNGGTFLDRVYGGGNMALVGDKHMSKDLYMDGSAIMQGGVKVDGDHPTSYVSVVDGQVVNDRTDLVGHINVNVHGGTFEKHIFLGARGSLDIQKNTFGFRNTGVSPEDNNKWNFSSDISARPSVLAYAYKQFNMDGGHVHFSVYGGSEAVDDGFPYECYGARQDSTSLAPSTVINIVGGTVDNRVYGGGYKGNCYGSIYVNVGVAAVDECPVWNTPFGPIDPATGTRRDQWTDDTHGLIDSATILSPYTIPGSWRNEALSLNKSALYLNSSIYGGSDWGEAGANQYFNTRGFYGGINRIAVDGYGYSTSLGHVSTDPEMNIAMSIIGAGTSTNPGDINSRIIIRNYGDFYCPQPSKRLFSIQRANYLYLDNAFITLTGEQDAYQSYTSTSQSLCRIDTVIFHDRNVIEQNASSIYIGMLRSETIEGDTVVHYTDGQHDMYGNTLAGCDLNNDPFICDLLSDDVVSNNVLMLNNGTYVDVYPFVDKLNDGIEDNDQVTAVSQLHPYGPVVGYFYLLPTSGTQGNVFARDKKNDKNKDDGGFVSPCRGCNTEGDFSDHHSDHEVNYTNVGVNETNKWPAFRSWTIGKNQGVRSRSVAIVAHAQPRKVAQDDYCTTAITTNGDHQDTTYYEYSEEGAQKFAYAKVSLELPPSHGGNYYTIKSVSIDNNNGNQVKLTDWAWDPAKTADGCSKWYTSYAYAGANTSDAVQPCSTAALQMQNNPDYTFGLLMKMGNHFDNSVGSVVNPEDHNRNSATKPSTIISGNTTLTNLDGFTSTPVESEAAGVIPLLDFYLTYRTDIATTITRDVVFTMNEYDATGALVGPVEVTLTISTIISDFKDLEARTLAMYNNGTSNEYVRQVIIPASFMQRTLYLESIDWEPDKEEYNTDPNHYFNLLPSTGTGITPVSSYEFNQFSLSISPSEDITQNISNTLGWYTINSNSRTIDPVAIGKSVKADVDCRKSNFGQHDWDDFRQEVGILDGRAAASLNVKLNFNGDKLFGDLDPAGWVTLHFSYKTTLDPTNTGTFDLRIRIRTRESGDTIYMAEQKRLYLLADGTVDRTHHDDETVPTDAVVTLYRYDYDDLNAPLGERKYVPNDPVLYLSDFSRASEVYQEGDVLCILDTIHISKSIAQSLRGSNFGNITVCRYSGSHFRFPGDSCAYRGPMIMLEDGARFTASNVFFEGSGCSRILTSVSASGEGNGASNFTYGTQLSDITSDKINDHNGFTKMGNRSYNYHNTNRDTLFADAPVFWLEGAAYLNLSSNVRVVNNYNRSQIDLTSSDPYVDGGLRAHFPGGAIGMRRIGTTKIPTVVIGNMVEIERNLVVDHNLSGHPLAYGGAIYSDGADIQLSVRNATAQHLISVDTNFYIPRYKTDESIVWAVDGLSEDGESSGTAAAFNGFFRSYEKTLTKPIEGGSFTRNYYELNTVTSGAYQRSADLHNSNVFLTRTPGLGTEAQHVQTDSKSDYINVMAQISNDSRIGVSKWFPGFKPRDNQIPRDTIVFASYATAGSFAAQNNINGTNCVFFDDSASYAGGVRQRKGTRYYDDLPSPLVSVQNPDDVDIRFSTLLNPSKVYFHRCATFGEAALPIMYVENPHVVCPGDGDTILYNVDGGSARYTFKWQQRHPYNSETFINLSNPYGNDFTTPQGKFLPLALARNLSDGDVSYAQAYLRVTATEAGGCEVSHDIDILMKPVGVDEAEGASNATSFEGGKYFHNAVNPYFENVKVDDFLAPRPLSGDVYYYTSKTGDTLQTRPAVGVADPYIHYPVPGVAYISHPTSSANPDVAKVVRLYNYYKLDYEVKPEATSGIVEAKMGSTLFNDGNPLSSQRLCPGDVVDLKVTPATSWEFMMWDYDPTAGDEIHYVVHNPDPATKVVAYMAPSAPDNDYWYRTVTSASYSSSSDPHVAGSNSFEVDYHGNVHIYDNKGLAWLISTANGLNGQQPQSYAFDSIYIHPSANSNAYDMSGHKWTPIGTALVPFRGTITVPVEAGKTADIKNIIVNENELLYVGLFGITDSARISNLSMKDPIIKGPAYAGALAGYTSDNSLLKDNQVIGAALSGTNAVGGFAGRSANATFDGNAITGSRFVGPSLYAGGMVGEALNTRASTDAYYDYQHQLVNNHVEIDVTNLQPLYVGGSVGTGTATGNGLTDQYAAITVVANNSLYGTVTGTGRYLGGETVTISAVPNEGYEFRSWSDGDQNSTREVTAIRNTTTTYMAIFAALPGTEVTNVTLSVTSSDVQMGTVALYEVNSPDPSQNREFPVGTNLRIKATANPGFHFTQWVDGNQTTSTFAERTIVVADTCSTYSAVFALNDGQYFYVVADADHPEYGTVSGSGRYSYDESVTITATPNPGFLFAGWTDLGSLSGNTAVPGQTSENENDSQTTIGSSSNVPNNRERSVKVTSNLTYTAQFIPDPTASFTVSVSSDPVNGGEVAVYNGNESNSTFTFSPATLAKVVATPYNGYTFGGWMDANDQSGRVINERAEYSFKVLHNTTLKALFLLNQTTGDDNNGDGESGNETTDATDENNPDDPTTGNNGNEGEIPAPAIPAAPKSGNGVPLYIANNYIRLTSGTEALYAGGLVGYGYNVNMSNNYTYGTVNSMTTDGGFVGRAGDGVFVDHCYYEHGTHEQDFGSGNMAVAKYTSTFSGSGNQVLLADTISGVDNMTRALNLWVRNDSTGIYKTWRSDLDGVNHGYPIFGDPDQIPVYAQTSEVVCDSMNLDGIIITESGDYVTIFSDTVNYVDSILTIHLTVNHGELVEYDETIDFGDEYFGNGFNITDAMIRELLAGDTLGGVRVLQFVDSLLTEQGCDSIVVLNLSVTGSPLGIGDREQLQVSVYPNPTVGVVNVEGDGLQHVDVYDNSSRQLYNSDVVGSKFTFDLSGKASGSYYLRIVTTHGTVVRKVIKK